MTALIGSVPEQDEEQEIIEREEGGWLVDGQTSFYDFLAHFDLEDYYSEFNYNTISGLILSLLEHIPKEGRGFIGKASALKCRYGRPNRQNHRKTRERIGISPRGATKNKETRLLSPTAFSASSPAPPRNLRILA